MEADLAAQVVVANPNSHAPHLTTDRSLASLDLPKSADFQLAEYDPVHYVPETDIYATSNGHGEAVRLRARYNTIRWTQPGTVTEPDGAPLPPLGDATHRTNSAVLRWSDGSRSLLIGGALYDLVERPRADAHLMADAGEALAHVGEINTALKAVPVRGAAGPNHELVDKALATALKQASAAPVAQLESGLAAGLDDVSGDHDDYFEIPGPQDPDSLADIADLEP
jgi:hypothetical protein